MEPELWTRCRYRGHPNATPCWACEDSEFPLLVRVPFDEAKERMARLEYEQHPFHMSAFEKWDTAVAGDRERYLRWADTRLRAALGEDTDGI